MESPREERQSVELSVLDCEQVNAALKSIEAAQLLIDEARRQICSVPGFGDQWSNLGPVHQTVKTAWHDLHDRLRDLH